MWLHGIAHYALGFNGTKQIKNEFLCCIAIRVHNTRLHLYFKNMQMEPFTVCNVHYKNIYKIFICKWKTVSNEN